MTRIDEIMDVFRGGMRKAICQISGSGYCISQLRLGSRLFRVMRRAIKKQERILGPDPLCSDKSMRFRGIPIQLDEALDHWSTMFDFGLFKNSSAYRNAKDGELIPY